MFFQNVWQNFVCCVKRCPDICLIIHYYSFFIQCIRNPKQFKSRPLEKLFLSMHFSHFFLFFSSFFFIFCFYSKSSNFHQCLYNFFSNLLKLQPLLQVLRLQHQLPSSGILCSSAFNFKVFCFIHHQHYSLHFFHHSIHFCNYFFCIVLTTIYFSI